MAKKKVFVSFDFENDRNYKYLLEAWNNNSEFEFTMEDKSSREINSWNISTIKGSLTTKINQSNYTIVIIGRYANVKDKNSDIIGYRNWQNFEIAKSKENGNKLIGVKLNSTYESPEELLGAGANWATYSVESIIKALNS
ncbi:MAG: TIR domain-containing protein [Clostridia bacterium]|nr:TIR domain-containing protein [Clostridia bacterium]